MIGGLRHQVLNSGLKLLRSSLKSTCACTSIRLLTEDNKRSEHQPIKQKLFTPGPLGVSAQVKQAMLRDLGTRHYEFIDIISVIRRTLLKLAEVDEKRYTCIPMQGSGTFAVESAIVTSLNRQEGKVVILENGVYGRRIAKICDLAGIKTHVLSFSENQPINVNNLRDVLSPDVMGVVAIHCETTSGIVNPVEEAGEFVKSKLPECTFIVDAMSSFGAIPLDLIHCDFMISSANKCLQGVPGLAYVIANKRKLKECKGKSSSLSLDLVDQADCLDKTGQFRFTPPTHVMLAFREALLELEAEGGIQGRAKRYKENADILKAGMKEMGFKSFLDQSKHPLSYIITSFYFPKHENFVFEEFYRKLSETGNVIYPGSLTKAKCFRIGTIGHIFPGDVRYLLECVKNVCKDMNISLPLQE